MSGITREDAAAAAKAAQLAAIMGRMSCAEASRAVLVSRYEALLAQLHVHGVDLSGDPSVRRRLSSHLSHATHRQEGRDAPDLQVPAHAAPPLCWLACEHTHKTYLPKMPRFLRLVQKPAEPSDDSPIPAYEMSLLPEPIKSYDSNVDPFIQICQHHLLGACNDSKCEFQHLSHPPQRREKRLDVPLVPLLQHQARVRYFEAEVRQGLDESCDIVEARLEVIARQLEMDRNNESLWLQYVELYEFSSSPHRALSNRYSKMEDRSELVDILRDCQCFVKTSLWPIIA